MKLTLLLALMLPLPATAGALSDLLMAPGLFEDAGDGPLLAYAEARAVPEGAGLAPAGDGRLLLAVAEGPEGRSLALPRTSTAPSGRCRPSPPARPTRCCSTSSRRPSAT